MSQRMVRHDGTAKHNEVTRSKLEIKHIDSPRCIQPAVCNSAGGIVGRSIVAGGSGDDGAASMRFDLAALGPPVGKVFGEFGAPHQADIL